jgi:hypothetical protein
MEDILSLNPELKAIRAKRAQLRSNADTLTAEFKTGLDGYAKTLKRDIDLFQSKK